MTISDCILQSFSSFHMTWNVKASIFNHKRETYSNVTAVLPRTVLCPHSPHCWSFSKSTTEVKTITWDYLWSRDDGESLSKHCHVLLSLHISPFVPVLVGVKGYKVVSGDLSERPGWHLTSNWVCCWPWRIQLNNGRHVPWSCCHGNIWPLRNGGGAGSKLGLFSDLC